MGKLIDLTGQKFGKLTVVDRAANRGKETMWNCICECGNSTTVGSGCLRSGSTKSCGCNRFNPSHRKTHGQSHSRLYYVYRNMLNRCYNPKVNDFPNYGGRGISVCDEWRKDFQSFYDWAIISGYRDGLKRGECTLDRKNPDGNYSPDNCRWTDEKTQQNNKRSNHYITFQGETKTMAEWAAVKHIRIGTLSKRINVLGWSIERALNTP